MLALAFFSWWYGTGWKLVSKKALSVQRSIMQIFSVGLLFKTLFQPWRRIITNPGAGVADHFHAALDNLVSRFIGFMVRIFVIAGALFASGFMALVGVLQLLIWPLLPPAVILTLVLGFTK